MRQNRSRLRPWDLVAIIKLVSETESRTSFYIFFRKINCQGDTSNKRRPPLAKEIRKTDQTHSLNPSLCQLSFFLPIAPRTGFERVYLYAKANYAMIYFSSPSLPSTCPLEKKRTTFEKWFFLFLWQATVEGIEMA